MLNGRSKPEEGSSKSPYWLSEEVEPYRRDFWEKYAAGVIYKGAYHALLKHIPPDELQELHTAYIVWGKINGFLPKVHSFNLIFNAILWHVAHEFNPRSNK